MKVQLNVKGKSQYAESVNEKYRSSACGPTTVHVLLNYICEEHELARTDINTMYNLLGSTRIGLFTWRIVGNLRKLLGPDFHIATCSLEEALQQLDKGIPVAMKFDKWFSLQWFTKKKPLFNYHWVPLIGYEIVNDELYFILHDNGHRTRDSQIRKCKYDDNKHVLSFVKIEAKKDVSQNCK